MKWLSRKWLIGILVLVLLLLAWLMLRQPAVVVEVDKVKRGEMLVTIDGDGKTRVRERFVVTAPIAGKMRRIKLKEGDMVPKDFVVTGIDPTPLERPLPPSAGENFPNVTAVKVYSPVSGKILRIIEKDERIVAAGTPILEIGNSGNLEIVVDVLSAQATQIKPGDKMLIENWGGSQPLSARVRKIEPRAFTKVSALGVEEQRVNVVADLVSKNQALGDNFRVDTSIITWHEQDVLTVNSSALFRQGEKWNAFVVEGGRARQREVEIGHQNVSESEIIKGLSENDKVILHPSNQIEDGVSVTSQ